MKIEPPTNEYIEEWTSLVCQKYKELPWSQEMYKEQVTKFFEDEKCYHPYMVKEGNKILAIGALVIKNGKEGYIDHFVTSERDDISLKTLLDFLLDEAYECQLSKVSIWIWDSEEKKIHLIKNAGFRSTAELALMLYQLSDKVTEPISEEFTISSLKDGIATKDFVTANRIAFKDDTSRPLKVEELDEWLQEPSRFLPELQLVALVNSRLVGTVMSEIFEAGELDDTSRQAWIYGLGVIPEWRRKGVGRSLVNELLTRVQGLGIKDVWILTDSEGGIREFYDELNFVEKNRWRKFEYVIER
jgi:GNAT superfamily N-acetyltransferase